MIVGFQKRKAARAEKRLPRSHSKKVTELGFDPKPVCVLSLDSYPMQDTVSAGRCCFSELLVPQEGQDSHPQPVRPRTRSHCDLITPVTSWRAMASRERRLPGAGGAGGEHSKGEAGGPSDKDRGWMCSGGTRSWVWEL